MKKPLLYLAGPEVFLPNAEEMGRRKCELAASRGLEGLFPLEPGPSPAGNGGGRRSLIIYDANLRLMRQADGGILNLTPFRGPGADPGTAFEAGYMAALGLPLVAYSLDGRDYRQRIPGEQGVDRDGLGIEDFGLADNLMLEAAVNRSGGQVLRGELTDKPTLADWNDLELFVRALDLWCERFYARS